MHEPECLEATSPREGFYECMCDDLRAAYERGREDAANAVNELYTVKVVDDGLADLLETAIARARGKS